MIRSLSKWQKVALWVAVVWLLFCLMGSIIDSWYSLLVVCIALLAAILCLFNNKLNAKYAWTVFAVSIVLPFVMIAALADPKDDNSTEKEAEKVEKPKNAVKSENTKKSEKETTDKAEKKKEQEPKQSPKEKEVAEAGANQGALFGMVGASNEEFSNMLDLADYVEGMDDKVDEILKETAGGEYDKQYGTPTNAEERKLKKIYVENFMKAMNNTMDGMDALEKLGGKRR